MGASRPLVREVRARAVLAPLDSGADRERRGAYGSLRSMAPDAVHDEAAGLAELGFGVYKVKVGSAGLEYLDVAAGVLASPARVVDGAVVLPDEPGSGVARDEDAVDDHRA